LDEEDKILVICGQRYTLKQFDLIVVKRWKWEVISPEHLSKKHMSSKISIKSK